MILGLCGTAVACTDHADGPAASGGVAGMPSAGMPGGGATSMSGTGGASAGSTTGGAGAAAIGGGGASTGGAGNGGGGSAGTGGSGGSAGAAGSANGCAAPATICDDFEGYTSGATDLSPQWIAYTYSGTVRVDTTKPHAGAQSLHLNTQAGMRHYADIIRETRGQELLPKKHYGRVMLWLAAVPPSSHWNINLSSGPLTGFPDEIGKYAEGGMFGKMMSNYAQRARAMKDGAYLLRGGGPEQGDAAADADCAVAAPAQTIQAGKWLCWEWEFDGTNDEAHLWVDGQAMTEVDAVHNGTQCQGPGFGGKPMMTAYRWESPQVWDKLIIGYEQYQDTPAQEVWIDDVAVGGERIGCPP